MSPTQLLESINAVRSRARALAVVRGVGVVASAAVGLLVGVIVVDYLLNLRALPRVLAMAGSVGLTAWLAYRHVARPAVAALSLSDVAGRLEGTFPQFEDRLRSAVNFSESTIPGSGVLQQCVMEQAGLIAGQVDLRSAVVARPAVMSVTTAAGAWLLLLFIGFGLLDPNVRAIITSRLINPFHAMAWPKSVQINLTTSVPDRVPVGQRIDVRMKLDRGDKASMRPVLFYQMDNGPVQQMYMSRTDAGDFQASLDARLDAQLGSTEARGKLTAWIEAGDDRRDLPGIHVVPRLSIKQITARVTPPAYVPGRSVSEQDLSRQPVVTPEGSGIELVVQFSKPLATDDPRLEPIAADAKPITGVAWTRASTDTLRAAFTATESARFRVRATDVDGFANAALEEYELVVRPDANMSLQLENPRRNEERTASAFVPLQALAEDDCGIEWVKLVVSRVGNSPQTWDVPMVTQAKAVKDVAWEAVEASSQRTRFRLNYQWELAPLKLNPGDVIEYYLQARDNFDLSGRRHEPVNSSRLRVTIVSQEDLAARVADEVRAARAQTSIVRQSQQRTKQETQQLGQETQNKPTLDPADRSAAERLAQQQSSTAASTKQVATRMQSAIDRLNENRSTAEDLKAVTQEVRKTLDNTAEGAMKDAASKLANSADAKSDAKSDPKSDAKSDTKSDDAKARNENLEGAQSRQQTALDQLDRAMQRMDAVGSLQSSVAEIAAILSQQRELRKQNEDFSKQNIGKKPEQLPKTDKDKLDSIADRQNKLSERTDAAIERMQTQSKQMEKSDPSSSDAMKQSADAGQQSKVSQNQKKASQQTSQNQQASAQQTQQQVELGLEQMLQSLKEAERRELARLRDELAKLQEQVATLVRRQSGHNLDNVLARGPDALKAIDPAVVASLTEASGRKAADLKKPEARLLSPAQELTERNARDLAQSADANPQTAEVGQRLTKAAGKMERAIVSLRAGSLAEAYDPPQVEALAALLEAKKIVDEQKDKADEKTQSQQRDALRQRYEKLKADQDKINQITQRVDASRDAKGAVPRTQWPALASLPKEQSTVTETAAAIEPDLESLGSIIYVWANRDIKNAMSAVGDDLTAQKTGVPTRAEQDRIVEQLAAMIEHLKEPPQKDEKFENANAGAGKGEGKGEPPVKMPTEAELKLLKSLQQAVNKSTTTIDAQVQKDKPKLLSLGNRQGELRNLLGELLKKSSQGQIDLGAEPDNKDQLPEEAAAEDVDQKELEDMLLGDNKTQEKVEQDFKLVGTRMARSRQRLAIATDPGKVTQEIQRRIVLDLDGLIEMARKNAQKQQQQQASGAPKPGQAPKPDQQQANNQGQNKPGQNKPAEQPGKAPGDPTQNAAGAGSKPRDLKEITETASEWGNLPPRVRDAVIEGRGETVVEQYRKLIEDYYEALSKQSK